MFYSVLGFQNHLSSWYFYFFALSVVVLLFYCFSFLVFLGQRKIFFDFSCSSINFSLLRIMDPVVL